MVNKWRYGLRWSNILFKGGKDNELCYFLWFNGKKQTWFESDFSD